MQAGGSMTPHRAINWLLAIILALLLSSTYLLDGPSELDAMQAVQADLLAAIAMSNTKESRK